MVSYDICLCLTYFTYYAPSLHVAANGIISFFLWLSNIVLCIGTTSSLSIHLSVDT